MGSEMYEIDVRQLFSLKLKRKKNDGLEKWKLEFLEKKTALYFL